MAVEKLNSELSLEDVMSGVAISADSLIGLITTRVDEYFASQPNQIKPDYWQKLCQQSLESKLSPEEVEKVLFLNDRDITIAILRSRKLGVNQKYQEEVLKLWYRIELLRLYALDYQHAKLIPKGQEKLAPAINSKEGFVQFLKASKSFLENAKSKDNEKLDLTAINHYYKNIGKKLFSSHPDFALFYGLLRRNIEDTLFGQVDLIIKHEFDDMDQVLEKSL